MNHQIFSPNEWIYPDTEITKQNAAVLYSARNMDTCFQLLTDHRIAPGEHVQLTADLPAGITVQIEQLLSAHVGENSAATTLTTTDYESVKHFVTRRAPFDVYEVCRPLDKSDVLTADGGRAAFLFRVNVSADAPVGQHRGMMTLSIGDDMAVVDVVLTIYNTVIPSLSNANFHMVNWIYYDRLAEQNGVEQYSPESTAAIDYMEFIDELEKRGIL